MENKIFTLHKTVTEADTAAHVGSGSLWLLCRTDGGRHHQCGNGDEYATYRGQPGGDESDCYGGTDRGGGQNSFFQGLCRRYRRCHRRGQPYPRRNTGGALYGKDQRQAGPMRVSP